MKNMKKKDFYLIFALLLVIGAGFLLRGILYKDTGSVLTITVNGEVFGTYKLEENQEIAINETNICLIEDGKASMTHANCPDQVCVHSAAIEKSGQTIICMPNRVVLEVSSPENNDVDAVT